MDAQAAAGRLHFPSAGLSLWPQLASTLANSLLAFLALGGLLICIRRASGALVEPLPAPVLVGLGGFLALAVAAIRSALTPAIRQGAGTAVYLCRGAASAVLILWAVGLSSNEASSGGLVGLWGLLLAEEGWSWGRVRRNVTAPKELNGMVARSSVAVLESAPSRAPALVEEDEDIESVLQQVVRRRRLDGSEVIEGWVRAELSAGQRHGAAHIAICPPLDRVPQCFAEQMDGPAAQIKIGQVLPYGARFEIKLDKPAEQATSVVVEFSIQDAPAVE